MMEAPDVADVDDDQNTSEFVRLYFHFDGRTNVCALTDASESIVESYECDPYGNLTIKDKNGSGVSVSQVGNPFVFQRRRHDFEAGLMYFRARHYDPVAGQWLQRDPLGIAPGANMMEFAMSSPIQYCDPLGLDPGEPNPPPVGPAPDGYDEAGSSPVTKQITNAVEIPGTDRPVTENYKSTSNPDGTTTVEWDDVVYAMYNVTIQYHRQDYYKKNTTSWWYGSFVAGFVAGLVAGVKTKNLAVAAGVAVAVGVGLYFIHAANNPDRVVVDVFWHWKTQMELEKSRVHWSVTYGGGSCAMGWTVLHDVSDGPKLDAFNPDAVFRRQQENYKSESIGPGDGLYTSSGIGQGERVGIDFGRASAGSVAID